jgi:Skp family chaperone for outer membrane proteins
MFKKISTIAAILMFAALFATNSFAQAQPAAAKIGWIVTAAFGDDKEGITKYVTANKSLDAEMLPRVNELKAIQTKLQTIADDIKKMQSNPAVPVNQQALAAKQDEGEKLQRDYEYKQKDAQAIYQSRREAVLGPITGAIFTALQEYAKTKGYGVIIDASTLGNPDQPSPILVLDPSANITKDFVTWYNARPATTATTAKPQ